MSKRIFCFLFMCIFCLSFVACGTETRDDGKVVLLNEEEEDSFGRYLYHEREYCEIPFLTLVVSEEDTLIAQGEKCDYYACTDADAPPYFCRAGLEDGRPSYVFAQEAYDERSLLFAVEGTDDIIAYGDVFSDTPVLLSVLTKKKASAYIYMPSTENERLCLLVGLVETKDGWYGKSCNNYRAAYAPLSDEFVALLRRHGYIAPDDAAETAASAEAGVVATP